MAFLSTFQPDVPTWFVLHSVGLAYIKILVVS